MQHSSALIEGAPISRHVGPVIIRISRNVAAYLITVEYASTGQQIDALRATRPTEQTARDAANTLRVQFRDGLTVEQVIKAIAAAPPMPTAAPSKPLMSDAQYDTLSRAASAGTSEIIRFDDCNISTLYALAKRGLTADITFAWVERTNRRTGRKKLVRVVIGATVTARGWRDLDAERVRRAAVRILDEQLAKVGVTR